MIWYIIWYDMIYCIQTADDHYNMLIFGLFYYLISTWSKWMKFLVIDSRKRGISLRNRWLFGFFKWTTNPKTKHPKKKERTLERDPCSFFEEREGVSFFFFWKNSPLAMSFFPGDDCCWITVLFFHIGLVNPSSVGSSRHISLLYYPF